MLTQLCERLNYHPDTGVFTWVRSGKVAGSLRPSGYIAINLNKKLYQAHRLAWLYVYGSWPKTHIDHINCDRQDNRIVNLRDATPSQNIANSRLSAANKTGFKGVSFDKRKGLFRAVLGKNGRQIFLGYFTKPDEAHKAYVKAAQTEHGEFARAF